MTCSGQGRALEAGTGENGSDRVLELPMFIARLPHLELIVEGAARQSGERKQVRERVLLP